LFVILPSLGLFIAIGLLILLAVIDFKTYLLPNIYVFPFAALAPLFHWLTGFAYLSPVAILMGGLGGYALLWLMRAYYKQDSLGLGDVKLMGAAGLWLGLDGVLFAMTIGAAFGLLHGIIYALCKSLRHGEKFSLTRLMIPAGPGFIAGIFLVGAWHYQEFAIRAYHDLVY